ncbi:MAG: LysR family transcriptional regulator [Pseudomonadota bacterium]
MPQDLNDLYFFAQVVDHRGFAPASRALGVPKSKLSRRVALLEERLGVRLIQRSTRRFSVTEVGETYYRHCKAMLVEAEAAQQSIDAVRAEPQGIVRISCPVALLQTRVAAMLAEFLVLYPRIEIHLESTNRRVDVIAEGLDIAIRARAPPLEDSGLVMRTLAQRSWCLVASPLLCERYHLPAHPTELAGLPSLDMGPPRRDHLWDLEGPGGAVAAIPHAPRLITDDMVALRTAAVAGVGIVQLPVMVMGGEVRRGELVKVLPEWRSKGAVIHAVFPTRRGLLPSVRTLIDFLAERFAAIEEI